MLILRKISPIEFRLGTKLFIVQFTVSNWFNNFKLNFILQKLVRWFFLQFGLFLYIHRIQFVASKFLFQAFYYKTYKFYNKIKKRRVFKYTGRWVIANKITATISTFIPIFMAVSSSQPHQIKVTSLLKLVNSSDNLFNISSPVLYYKFNKFIRLKVKAKKIILFQKLRCKLKIKRFYSHVVYNKKKLLTRILLKQYRKSHNKNLFQTYFIKLQKTQHPIRLKLRRYKLKKRSLFFRRKKARLTRLRIKLKFKRWKLKLKPRKLKFKRLRQKTFGKYLKFRVQIKKQSKLRNCLVHNRVYPRFIFLNFFKNFFISLFATPSLILLKSLYKLIISNRIWKKEHRYIIKRLRYLQRFRWSFDQLFFINYAVSMCHPNFLFLLLLPHIQRAIRHLPLIWNLVDILRWFYKIKRSLKAIRIVVHGVYNRHGRTRVWVWRLGRFSLSSPSTQLFYDCLAVSTFYGSVNFKLWFIYL